jgi:hypothetical protein
MSFSIGDKDKLETVTTRVVAGDGTIWRWPGVDCCNRADEDPHWHACPEGAREIEPITRLTLELGVVAYLPLDTAAGQLHAVEQELTYMDEQCVCLITSSLGMPYLSTLSCL